MARPREHFSEEPYEHARSPVEGRCVEAPGCRTRGGYGVRKVRGKQWGAHRLAFYEAYGYLPEVVRHRCDNPGCVNPEHLEPGTHRENHADRARLDSYQVAWVRLSKLPGKVVADWLGVSQSMVSLIRKGTRYVKN